MPLHRSQKTSEHRAHVVQTWRFARRWAGRALTTNGTIGENANGAQCVNVPNTWWEAHGAPALWGNAVDWIGVEDDYRTWHTGTQDGMRVGDVGVFLPGGTVSPEGHVDLCLNAVPTLYVGLDQDWPVGALVSYVRHEREVLAGFIRIRHW